jgi:hypothetical protein
MQKYSIILSKNSQYSQNAAYGGDDGDDDVSLSRVMTMFCHDVWTCVVDVD